MTKTSGDGAKTLNVRRRPSCPFGRESSRRGVFGVHRGTGAVGAGRVKPFGIIIRRLCKAQTKWLIPNSSEIRQHFFGLPYSLSMDGARRGMDGVWIGHRRGADGEWIG